MLARFEDGEDPHEAIDIVVRDHDVVSEIAAGALQAGDEAGDGDVEVLADLAGHAVDHEGLAAVDGEAHDV